MLRVKWIFAAIIAIASWMPLQAQQTYSVTQPRQVVLTWQQDPTTTMTITWRTDTLTGNHRLHFVEKNMETYGNWKTLEAESFTFDETSAWLHTVELTQLLPNKEYAVVIEHPTHPDKFFFRTIPAQSDQKELVMLAGGDSRSRRDIRREVNALAAAENPDFIIFDGDFISSALNEQQWDEWFDDWHEQMITAEGHRVPIVTAIGNHEVQGGYLQPKENAPFFFNRFITPQPRNYYVLEFGPDLVLITLDTDHVTEVTQQNDWLEKTLLEFNDKPWKIVQYHVAAWPSVRDFDGELPTKIREQWIPILEKYNVDLVIEAHDHAYKKTVPIRNNERNDENGIVYLGDGGWGAPVRDTKGAVDYWWLEEALKIDHFWKIVLSKDGKTLTVDPVFRHADKSFSITK